MKKTNRFLMNNEDLIALKKAIQHVKKMNIATNKSTLKNKTTKKVA